jgi:hypothetical protein
MVFRFSTRRASGFYLVKECFTMIRKVAVVLLGATLFCALPAHAQMKLPGLGGKSDSSSSSSAVPDEAAQDALVQQFLKSQMPVLDAQTAFAKAFGLAEQVQALEAQKQALSSGATDKDALKKSSEVGESAQKALDAAQAAKPVLDAEAKAHYAEGLVALVMAAVEGKKLTDEAQGFADAMKSVRGPQAMSLASKLSAGVWVAKESPGYIKSLYGNLKSALTFAKANDIPVPKDADSLSF